MNINIENIERLLRTLDDIIEATRTGEQYIINRLLREKPDTYHNETEAKAYYGGYLSGLIAMRNDILGCVDVAKQGCV